jgi:PPOX class probable F420-dependent enzyme
MTDLHDPEVQTLLQQPNYAVIATKNPDGSILSTVVWVDVEDGSVTVNSAVGRQWPTNLERDPHISLLVFNPENPFHFVEVRGRAEGSTDGADAHIDSLAKKYLGKDEYPFRQPGERRIKFMIRPDKVRLFKQ